MKSNLLSATPCFKGAVVGAALLISADSSPAKAQINSVFIAPSGARIVLPGDVSIEGSSTRGQTRPASTSASTTAQTQQESAQRRADLEKRLNAINVGRPADFGAVLPGITSNTPIAYGGFKGQGAVGIAYQDRTRFSNKSDGIAGVALSFGSPQTVGLDVVLTALDLSNKNGGSFGSRSALSLKAHRPLNDTLAVALGVEDLIASNKTPDQRRSVYGVVTKQLNLKPSSNDAFSRLHLSLGVGNGRFQSENDVFAGRNGIGVFGSVAVQATPAIRPFAEWTGQDMNVGASIVPFKRIPLIITPALADITGSAGNRTRFTLSAGYRFSY